MAKILIVDDSDVVRKELRQVLESESYEVIEGVDGQDGLNIAQSSEDIDLIITDYNMPNMDGVTMVENIKQIPHYTNKHALMLTTEFDPELRSRGKKAGIKTWIVKPLNPDTLKKVLNKLLSK